MPFKRITTGKNKGKYRSPSGKIYTKKQMRAYYARKGFKRVVDKRMRDFGDIDYQKKKIRVNPRKGDLLNTIIHEEIHRKHPDKSEKWVKKKTFEEEKKLGIAQAQKILDKYKRKRK